MTAAPRDGTWVEVKNTHGVAPWYDLARWSKEGAVFHISMGQSEPYIETECKWRLRKGGSVCGESHLKWRPYTGDVEAYVDPTGGLQDDPAYWRGAVAGKYGKRLDYFEPDVGAHTPVKKRLRTTYILQACNVVVIALAGALVWLGFHTDHIVSAIINIALVFANIGLFIMQSVIRNRLKAPPTGDLK